MSILYPSLDTIKKMKVQPTDGEWALLNFLIDNLDDTYEIFFQPYLNGDNPDFVIMREGSGVLIIEVKDWNLQHYYIDERTNWKLIKNEVPIKSPLTQVENYKSNLYNLHSEELFEKSIKNKKHWAIVNCAVYFHNATEGNIKSFLLTNFDGDKHEYYRKFVNKFGLLGNNSLNTQNLNSLLDKFWLNRTSYLFDKNLHSSFKRYLKPPIHLIEEGIQIIYSKEQQELTRSEIRPRRKVKGAAGSGKTLVLAKRAVNAHKRTMGRVLILTYNISLKNYIQDRISDVREEFNWNNFYITNYHQFFKSQANNYNLEAKNISDWQNTLFFESAKNRIEKFDVILIDEIQDYMQPWIDIITNYFMHSETEFVVFGDEKQNIYNRELDENNEPIVRTIPGVWNKTLNTAYRFSGTIGNIATKFQKEVFGLKYAVDEINFISQFDFESRTIEYHYFKTYSKEKIFHKIYEILEKNEIHSSDVGILCSKVEILRDLDFLIRTIKHEKTTTSFESQEEFESLHGDHDEVEKIRKVRKNHFWMKTGTLKLSTVHSFKGWETNTLFLFINEEENEKEKTNAEIIYTGLTRARQNLIVFNLNNSKYDNFFNNEIETKFKHE